MLFTLFLLISAIPAPKPRELITISDNFIIHGEKTISIQERGKLNPKFLLALNDTVNDNGNWTTTLWYLTVTSTEHGEPVEAHLTANASDSHFFAWGRDIPGNHSENVIGWFGTNGNSSNDGILNDNMHTDWFIGLARQEKAPWSINTNELEVNRLWDRFYDSMKGRSHQYWHFDGDDRLVSRATGDVVAASALNETGTLGLVRKVSDEDSLAKYQKWTIVEHGAAANHTTTRNDTINEMQLLSQEDGYGRIQTWALNYFSHDDYVEETYNYWSRARYEYMTDALGYDLRGDACNTEIIRADDWLFGLVPRAPEHHRSNWTTQSGAEHFLYGEQYNSEYVEDVTIRGGIPAEKWVGQNEHFNVTHYFPHGNWSWQFNETNGQAPMLVEFEAEFPLHGVDFRFELSWHILYMLNQFDQHEMDAIVGEDPFKQDSTPKWADCDKSVTSFDDQRPVSIAGKNVDTRLEQVDKMSSLVSGVHLSFDLDDNITRIDYFDFEKGANVRRIEQKETQTLFEINRNTRQCDISQLTESWDWYKGKNYEPDQIFALPDSAVYNEPREVRQNVYGDSWLDTFSTTLEYGPYKGKNATCSNIFYYPGFYHHDQDGYTNEEPGMPLGYDSFCMDMGTGDILEDVTINNFATQASDYTETEFDVSACFSSDQVYDFYFTMTGPFDKLSSQMAQEFADSIIGVICVTTGLSLQNRLQHTHLDLFTDYELESPEIMVRFSLLPFTTFNDYEDLTNDEFLDRIHDPIDAEMIALTVYDPAHPDVNYWFHSVADSLAISYDGGVIYEPTSNKTVVKVKIEHEKGYSTGGLVGMTMLCLFGMIFAIVGVTWFRFKRSAATSYGTLE